MSEFEILFINYGTKEGGRERGCFLRLMQLQGEGGYGRREEGEREAGRERERDDTLMATVDE